MPREIECRAGHNRANDGNEGPWGTRRNALASHDHDQNGQGKGRSPIVGVGEPLKHGYELQYGPVPMLLESD
jgi:hypothetical protein